MHFVMKKDVLSIDTTNVNISWLNLWLNLF